MAIYNSSFQVIDTYRRDLYCGIHIHGKFISTYFKGMLIQPIIYYSAICFMICDIFKFVMMDSDKRFSLKPLLFNYAAVILPSLLFNTLTGTRLTSIIAWPTVFNMTQRFLPHIDAGNKNRFIFSKDNWVLHTEDLEKERKRAQTDLGRKFKRHYSNASDPLTAEKSAENRIAGSTHPRQVLDLRGVFTAEQVKKGAERQKRIVDKELHTFIDATAKYLLAFLDPKPEEALVARTRAFENLFTG